jgi:hypothetical protein
MKLKLDLEHDDCVALKNLLIQKRDEETGQNKILLGKLVEAYIVAENRLELQERILEKVKKILSGNTRREPYRSDWKKIKLVTSIQTLGIGKTRLKDIIRPGFNDIVGEEGGAGQITVSEAETLKDVNGCVKLIMGKIEES